MNTQIQDFITTNETKIFNKTGKAIAERALVLLAEYIKKVTDMIAEHRSNGFEIPANQPMLQPAFQALVRSIIIGEPVAMEPDSIAPTVAKNQIDKAIVEYEAMLAKE